MVLKTHDQNIIQVNTTTDKKLFEGNSDKVNFKSYYCHKRADSKLYPYEVEYSLASKVMMTYRALKKSECKSILYGLHKAGDMKTGQLEDLKNLGYI